MARQSKRRVKKQSKRQNGGGSAWQHAESVYGGIGQQHAADGSNVIAAKTVGGRKNLNEEEILPPTGHPPSTNGINRQEENAQQDINKTNTYDNTNANNSDTHSDNGDNSDTHSDNGVTNSNTSANPNPNPNPNPNLNLDNHKGGKSMFLSRLLKKLKKSRKSKKCKTRKTRRNRRHTRR